MAVATLVTIFRVITTIIDLYIYVVIAAVIASWLIAFGVVNIRNEFVRSVVRVLGGLDLSPLVVIVVLSAIEMYFFPILLDRLAQGSYL
jgi:YggT family protein